MGLSLMQLREITPGFCLPFLSSNAQPTDKLLQKPSKTQGA